MIRVGCFVKKYSSIPRQSSKGLEFKTVILAGLGTLKDDEKDQADEVRLFMWV